MSSQNQQAIAIIDDEEMVTRSLCSLLELETPYRVLTFTSPVHALEQFESGSPHVVVADFMMPEMDGITFFRRLRERHPHTTRILLTGYADKQNAIRGINEAGLYQYLEKPWDNEHLKMVVRNAMERSTLVSELEARVSALESANQDLSEIRRRIIQAFL